MNTFEQEIINNLKCWSSKKEMPPLLVSLRLTSKCDLKCVFCDPNLRIKSSEELKIEDYKRLFKELGIMKVKLCAIVGGGEALCKKDLTLQVIKLIKEHRMSGWLVTNGVNFDNDTVQKIVNLNLNSVLFSLDSPNPREHDYLRGKEGTFDKVTQNIQLFNYWKKKLKKKNPLLKIQMLITNKNYKEVDQMLDLTKKLGINKIILNYLVTHKKKWEKLQLNEKEITELEKKLRSLLKSDMNNQTLTNFKDYLQIIKLRKGCNKKLSKINSSVIPTYCFQPWYHLNISETGFVNFCPELDNKYGEGSIKRKSACTIWYGRNYKLFREKILNGKMINICERYCNLPIVVENLKIGKLTSRNG